VTLLAGRCEVCSGKRVARLRVVEVLLADARGFPVNG